MYIIIILFIFLIYKMINMNKTFIEEDCICFIHNDVKYKILNHYVWNKQNERTCCNINLKDKYYFLMLYSKYFH